MNLQGHAINPFQVQSASVLTEVNGDETWYMVEIKFANGTEKVFHYGSQDEAQDELDYINMIFERMLPRSSI